MCSLFLIFILFYNCNSNVVNFSRWSKIDPEEALTRSIEKFIKRFQIVEKNIKEQNKKFSDFKIDELESMWQSAKSHN